MAARTRDRAGGHTSLKWPIVPSQNQARTSRHQGPAKQLGQAPRILHLNTASRKTSGIDQRTEEMSCALLSSPRFGSPPTIPILSPSQAARDTDQNL